MIQAIKWQFISQFGDGNINVQYFKRSFWLSKQKEMRGCVSFFM
ncbi:hypothetical protein AtNW77_Chr3g0200681 [Arabidopsis thaliana]